MMTCHWEKVRPVAMSSVWLFLLQERREGGEPEVVHLRANMEDTISFESSPMETGAGNTVEETSGCDRYKGSKGEWKEWREGIGYINDIAVSIRGARRGR